MKKRINMKGPALRSRQEAARCMQEIQALTLRRDGLVLEMEERIKAVRDERAEEIADLGKDIEAEMTLLKAWADGNPAEFGQRRSVDFAHGACGYRLGQPRLALMRGWTWSSVVEALQLKKLTRYLRVKTDADKEKLLADRAAMEEAFADLGMVVKQDEAFFVEVVREKVPAVAPAPEAAAAGMGARGGQAA